MNERHTSLGDLADFQDAMGGAYLDPCVSSEQRRNSAKAPSPLRVGLKRVRLRRCSFVTYCRGYAPHSRLASEPF